MMSQVKQLYHARQLPVFQNRMFRNADEAIHCTKGDIMLVQDLHTGLIFNGTFNSDLMHYDADYQNEQVLAVFPGALEEVSKSSGSISWPCFIEVGCGKVISLTPTISGFQITGLDLPMKAIT
jgi:hypothetical protein